MVAFYVSGMQLGKLTLATDFAPRDITSEIPAFHRELFYTLISQKCYHERMDVPESLLDIFEEPFFRNKLINVNNSPLFFKDWVSCGLVHVKAAHETLTDHTPYSKMAVTQDGLG